MGWRAPILASLATAILLAGGGSLLFQDNISKFLMKPRAPIQIAPTPAPPDYSDPSNWLYWPVNEPPRTADVFYVHSTTYYSGDFWNAPLDDEGAAEVLARVAAPNEAGPFRQVGRVFAPRYRQATKATRFTHKYDGRAARALAFDDVSQAFAMFLKERDDGRPIVLVGYGQGAVHVMGLLRAYFDGGAASDDEDADLRRFLAAAYVIDAPAPRALFETLSTPLPVCDGKRAFRCVVAYSHFTPAFQKEAALARARAIHWAEDMSLVSLAAPSLACVNPISWRTDGAPASPEDHVGAASATGLGADADPPAVARAVGAQCVDGVLMVDPPRQKYLRRARWFLEKWRAQPFNLFYHDLAENAALRSAALSVKLREEAQTLKPIDDAVDISVSPIKKVPNNGG